MTDRIACVGTGLMGSGIASCLLRAGHTVGICANRSRANMDALLAAGAVEHPTLAALAAASDIIILSVSDSPAVEAALEKMGPSLRPGQVVIDASTSNPDATRQNHALLKSRGVRYADAPLTGGPAQAATGQVGSLVGCDEPDFALISAIVSRYSKTVQYMGPAGNGHYAKLLNNFVSQGAVALLTEAYARARDVGMDWNALYAVMLAGAARSGTLEKVIQPALAGDFDGSQFTIANAHKDLDYFCEQAQASPRGPSEVGEALRAVFRGALDQDWGNRYVGRLLDPSLPLRH